MLEVKKLELKAVEQNVYIEGFASSTSEDLQGEVISYEALSNIANEIVKEPYNKVFVNHKIEDIPIGKVVEAKLVDGKLLVKIMLNKDHPMFEAIYKSVKNGFLNTLSIGFNVVTKEGNVIKEAKVMEVSLVSIPANPDAKILAVYEKQLKFKGYVPSHPWKYDKDEESSWEKPNLADFTDKRFDELSEDEKRNIAGHFAWSANNPPKSFADLKLPHHDPKTHKVVWRGVVAAMAALMGARGGVDIPEEDKKRVYQHLAKHYEEFGKEPPELKDFDSIIEKYVELQFDLKSLRNSKKNMEEEKLKAEIDALKAENTLLKNRLAEYENKEKQTIIEKIKRISDIDETKLKELSIPELKILLGDLALKIIEKPADKVKTVIEDGFIETKFGRVDKKKLAEIRKAMSLGGD